MALSDKRRMLAGAMAAVAASILPAGQSNADEFESSSTSDFLNSAGVQAARWSTENWGGMGIIITVGTELPYTKEQLRSKFISLLNGVGLQAEVFIDKTDRKGSSIGFTYLGVGSDIYPLTDAEKGLVKSIRELKAGLKVYPAPPDGGKDLTPTVPE